MLSIAKSFKSRNKKKRRAANVREGNRWENVLCRELLPLLAFTGKVVLFLTIYDTIAYHLSTNGYPIAGLFAILVTIFGILLVTSQWLESWTSLRLAAHGIDPAPPAFTETKELDDAHDSPANLIRTNQEEAP